VAGAAPFAFKGAGFLPLLHPGSPRSIACIASAKEQREPDMRPSGQPGRRWHTVFSIVLFTVMAVSSYAQEGRKVIAQPTPVYPQLARKWGLSGTVKVQVIIAADGQVKDVKVVGGHPLFVDATLDALKKWKFAPSSSETTTTLEFNFHP
jgi:TonB family protein